MRFLVMKEFDWDGIHYSPGTKIEIPDNHPRLGTMISARFLTYDASGPSPDDERREAKPVSSKKR